MKSYIVKLNEPNEYFQVAFSPLNTIEDIKFVKSEKDATLFQNDAHIHKNERGMELSLGKIRTSEFSYFLYRRGIEKKDITVEEIDAPEQSLMTKKQKRECTAEFKMLKEHKMI